MDPHNARETARLPVRAKAGRAHSPNSPGADEHRLERIGGDIRGQPPPKRARKAINCEPCRNSKLKCDRNRPCSSCVLRGTTALCYQGQDSDSSRAGEQRRPVDPLAEISRIRQSLVVLESHIREGSGSRPVSVPAPAPPHPIASSSRPHLDGRRSPSHASSSSTLPSRRSSAGLVSTPGMLGKQGSGGLYTGPTSAVSNLISTSDREDSDTSDRPHSDPDYNAAAADSPCGSASPGTVVYDEDLIRLLPPIETTDALISYYFSYCNWIYRHVNEQAVLAGWARFKAGQSGDRIVLGTVFILLALAICYLPPGHALLGALPGPRDEIARKYHAQMRIALKRHRDSAESLTRTYTLALVELLLVETHLLTFAKEDPEEVWALAGELVSVGTAMGLHRDPGKHKFVRAVAERRRWAWWHIILFERWQAFMFGRPLHIASHHFDTQLPNPSGGDGAPRLFLPNLALFRLAYVLGDIMDDAISFRTVPYGAIQEKDRLLMQWYDALPPELNLDENAVAHGLTSSETSSRRLAVQSVIHRCAYYHIRFTLHRPYARIPASLDAAVSAASDLLTLFVHAHSTVPIPGHFNWGPFHVFSAAMFFSFQLITRPEQPGTPHFRVQVRKAFAVLEHARELPVADKALAILYALQPLYAPEHMADPPAERERRKAQVLRTVRTLAFPYQDSPPPYARDVDSPGYRPFSPGVTSAQDSPISEQPQTQPAISAMRWEPPPDTDEAVTTYHQMQNQYPIAHSSPSHILPSQQTVPAQSHTSRSHAHYQQYGIQPPPMQQPVTHHMSSGVYMHPADEGSMWGASVGFGIGEWAQFLNVVQRPEGPNDTL